MFTLYNFNNKFGNSTTPPDWFSYALDITNILKRLCINENKKKIQNCYKIFFLKIKLKYQHSNQLQIAMIFSNMMMIDCWIYLHLHLFGCIWILLIQENLKNCLVLRHGRAILELFVHTKYLRMIFSFVPLDTK